MSARDATDWRVVMKREAAKQARAKEREERERNAPLLELLAIARRIEKHLRNLEHLKRLPPPRLGRPPKGKAR